MGKLIILVSGILVALAWFGGGYLYLHNSPVADFVRFACFPMLALIFLLFLFGIRLRRMPPDSVTRKLIRGIRVAVLAGIAVLVVAIFLPRSYSAPQRTKSADLQYWDLPTGSHLAYTKVPAKGMPKPTPIIYLQGGPGGTIDGGLIKILSPIAEDGFDIYLYDQLGSGWSNRLANIRDYTVTRHKRDLEAIVQAIGTEKVILIGQSWGAILATAYAADNPGRVAALIVTGPGPIQPARPGLAGVRPPDSFQLHEPYYTNRQGNDLANNIRTRAMALVATSFGKKLASDEEADDFAGYANKLINRSTVADTSHIGPLFPANSQPTSSGPAGFYVSLMTVQSFNHTPDPRPKLKNTTIPILVMKGQYDNQKWGFTKEYLDIFPDHRLAIIPNAGHGIFIEQREIYLATIRDFLRQNTPLHPAEQPPVNSTIPTGGGFVLTPPNKAGAWDFRSFTFAPEQIVVNQGDNVTLHFVGVQGVHHVIEIVGVDTFELTRGQIHTVSFIANSPGTITFYCHVHMPNMVGQILVLPKAAISS